MTITIKQIEHAKISKPILIAGLPGIGNVGKIAVDFIIDSLMAKKIFEIHSYNIPNAVFVNEKNLVELPSIDMFYKKVNGIDILLLAGDIQPIDEAACYEFCDKILDLVEKFNVREVITLGGIGLPNEPNEPRVYCTGSNKNIIDKYKSKDLSNNIYGVVGPIIGVTGVLVGLAGRRKISALSILAETFGHPAYVGIKSARAILKILNEKFKLKLNFKVLDEEVTEIEKEMKTKISQIGKLAKKASQRGEEKPAKMNYIG